MHFYNQNCIESTCVNLQYFLNYGLDVKNAGSRYTYSALYMLYIKIACASVGFDAQ